MKTPAILNQTNISQNTGMSAKQSAPASSEASFSRTLSREIAERHHANEANENRPKIKEAGNGMHAASAPVPPATPSNVPKKTSDKATSSSETTEATDKTDEETPVASAEMLALVASLNQAAAAPAERSASDGLSDTLTASDVQNKGRDLAKDLLPSLKTGDLNAKDASVIQKAESEPTGKFASVLDLAAGKTSLPDLSETLREAVDPAMQKQEIPPELTAIAPPSLQQAAINTAQIMAGNPTEKLATHVGTSGWDQALGQKVVWMIAGAEQSATLTLNPPDLGPLQIVLNVSDTQATASFTSAQPEVRQAIEAAMPKLREMLNDAGIQLGQTSVNAGTPNQQGNAFGQSAQQNGHSSSRRGGATDMATGTAGSSPIQARGQGLINTFA